MLQLICDRAQALTQADGIVIALAEQISTNGSQPEPLMVCRAAAGLLTVERGVRLIGIRVFSRNAWQSGQILRCDDCATDARVEFDFAQALGARSTVLVPLRGRSRAAGRAAGVFQCRLGIHRRRCSLFRSVLRN